jgi:hypothetical protein
MSRGASIVAVGSSFAEPPPLVTVPAVNAAPISRRPLQRQLRGTYHQVLGQLLAAGESARQVIRFRYEFNSTQIGLQSALFGKG